MLRPIFRRLTGKQILFRSCGTGSGDAIQKPKLERTEKKTAKDAKETSSFVMSLFNGQVKTEQIFPYPDVLCPKDKAALEMMLHPLDKYLKEVNDLDKNDEMETLDSHLMEQLKELGIFGLQVPEEYEGLGLKNTQFGVFCEMLGRHDLSIAMYTGAHQSIGFKGIVLFGNKEQKQRYVPDLATGKKLAAFCLTEASSGSDVESIKTRAVKSTDGKYFTLNGSKLWITNGGIADIFTVFAKVPVESENDSIEKMAAFIVERSFEGVSNGPPDKKMGLKASNTAAVFFDNVKVPVENLIGEVGDGFNIAMKILNIGRYCTAFSMSGTMRAVIEKAADHAVSRSQFGNKICSYGTIQERLFRMCMLQYVTESMAYMVSGNMDQGSVDFHLEAAISKVYATEAAWYVVDEAIQILGGMGYMRSAGLERVLRDVRVFKMVEGSNDILRLFVVLTGLQHAGIHFKELQNAFKNPAANLGLIVEEGSKRARRIIGLSRPPSLSDHIHPKFSDSGALLLKCIEGFAVSVEEILIKHGKDIVHNQFLLIRLANAAIEIYAMTSILSRVTFSFDKNVPAADYEEKLVNVYCYEAYERVFQNLYAIKSKEKAKNFQIMKTVALDVAQNGGIIQLNPLGVPQPSCDI